MNHEKNKIIENMKSKNRMREYGSIGKKHYQQDLSRNLFYSLKYPVGNAFYTLAAIW